VIVTGDRVRVVVKDGGAVGAILEALGVRGRVRTRRRATPMDVRPQPFTDRVDRDDEVAALVAADPGTPLSLVGEALVGKTYVLRAALAETSLRLRDGVVVVHGRTQGLDDLLQSLWQEFIDSRPPSLPARAQIARELADVEALVVVDPSELEHDEAQELARVLGRCRLILASRTRRWYDGDELPVGGLADADALALLSRELDRSAYPIDRAVGQAVCRALAGHPLRIRQAAALVRTGGVTLDGLARRLAGGEPAQELASAAISTADDSDRRLLVTLAPFEREPIGAELLETLAGADLAARADELASRRLLVTGSPRYAVPDGLERALDAERLEEAEARAIERIVNIAEEQPDALRDEQSALVALLGRLQRRGRQADVIRLGRALAPVLVRARRPSSWAAAAGAVLEAARATGNQDAEAWALHEAGTHALIRGDEAEGRRLLEQAVSQRERLGDAAGAAASRHNLGIRLRPPWYVQTLVQLPLIVIAAVLVTLVAAGGGGAAWLIAHDDHPPLVDTDPTTGKPTSGATSDEATTTDESTTEESTSGESTTTTTEDSTTSESTREEPTTTTQPEHVLVTVSLTGDGSGTITSDGGEIACPGGCSASIAAGEPIVLKAIEDETSVLSAWGYEGCEAASLECRLAPREGVVVTPRFEPAFTLSIFPSGGGSVTVQQSGTTCSKACKVKLQERTEVTLVARAGDDLVFTRWGGRVHCARVPTCTFRLDGPLEIKATFAGPQLLTVTIDGDPGDRVTSQPRGIDCPADCQESFLWGTQVTLRAESRGPWFRSWEGGGCSQTGECILNLREPTAVTAHFEKAPP